MQCTTGTAQVYAVDNRHCAGSSCNGVVLYATYCLSGMSSAEAPGMRLAGPTGERHQMEGAACHPQATPHPVTCAGPLLSLRVYRAEVWIRSGSDRKNGPESEDNQIVSKMVYLEGGRMDPWSHFWRAGLVMMDLWSHYWM